MRCAFAMTVSVKVLAGMLGKTEPFDEVDTLPWLQAAHPVGTQVPPAVQPGMGEASPEVVALAAGGHELHRADRQEIQIRCRPGHTAQHFAEHRDVARLGVRWPDFEAR